MFLKTYRKIELETTCAASKHIPLTMAAAQSDASLRKYKKLSDRKHVLLRPDMYVGPTEPAATDMFVFEDGKIVSKSVRVSPALIKIFDEVLGQRSRPRDSLPKRKVRKPSDQNRCDHRCGTLAPSLCGTMAKALMWRNTQSTSSGFLR